MSQPFTGLVAAVHTPFQDDPEGLGAMALDVVPGQARHLARDGVAAVFVAGTTGEGVSLTANERRELLEAWAEIGPAAGLRVIAHVGGNCVSDAVELAAFCERTQGIEAIGAVAPSFLAPSRPEDVARVMGRIAAAAPSKPAYYYDIPVLTGIGFSARQLCEAFERHAPTLRGVKCTRFESAELIDFLRAGDGRYDVLAGRDEALLAALPLGIRGAVGSTYNFAAPLYLDLFRAFESGDHAAARELQARSIDLVNLLAGLDFLPACRALMEELGVPLGPPRLPLAPISRGSRAALLEALERLPVGRPARRGS